MVNGDVPGCSGVDSGVAQGSVLVQILFLCYINNMPDIMDNWTYWNEECERQILTELLEHET